MPDAPNPSSNSSIDQLVEQCILALEQDDHRRVDELLEANPDQAPELQRRLDQLAALGILNAPNSNDKIPEQLGDFRLLRQIGRGGMGIVYLAEQQQLERQVALKLVHPEQLFFAGARERFRREVLAIARLQHPGIVPILTGGEAEGIPFYAMELVHGASLAEVLQELVGTAPAALEGTVLRSALVRAMAKKHDRKAVSPHEVFAGTWSNVCSRLLLQATEALQHAHEQGVLHRDIKPSNLLVTADGHVRVIDFGLASTTGDARITRSGATLGSLPYMAPEQVRGKVDQLTERTDVYQLGITLYELLTLQLPHGDGSEETRSRILAGHVEPPSRVNAHVHPDLEAICLKAMDLDPQRRYADTAALAEDLTAFLERRTVRARKPSGFVRAQRWVRRKPLPAAAIAIAFVLFVVGPLAFALVQQAANTRIRQALKETEEQRANAEQNFNEALRSVDLMLLRTAHARLSEIPRTRNLRRQLVEDAIAIHNRLVAATEGGGSRLARARARSQLRLGQLHLELGQLSIAEQVLAEAIATLQPLSIPDDDYVPEYDLARCEQVMATIYGKTARRPQALAALQRSVATYDPIVTRFGAPELRSSWLGGRLHLASQLARIGDVERANRMFDALDADLEHATEKVEQRIDTSDRLTMHAKVAVNRGILAAKHGDPAVAVEHFREAIRRTGALPDGVEPSRSLRTQIASCTERLGIMLLQRRLHDQAEPWLERTCAEYEALAAAEPDLPGWRASLARVLGARANNQQFLRHPEEALADHDRAIALLQAVVDESPEDIGYQRDLTLAIAERATHLWHQRQQDEARVAFEDAGRHFEALLARDPDERSTRGNYAVFLANQAGRFATVDEYPAATAAMDKAIELQRTITGDTHERSLIEMLGHAADYALCDGERAKATAYIREALQRADRWLQASPQDPTRAITSTITAITYGRMQMSFEEYEEALSIWKAAVPTAQIAKHTRFGLRQLCLLQLRIAEACVRTGQIAHARKWFQRAVADGATKEMARNYPPFAALFDDPELQKK